MEGKAFSFFGKEISKRNKALIEKIDLCEENIEELSLYEVKLNKVADKMDVLSNLALKIKIENEKTNGVVTRQEQNLEDIGNLIEKQINIIDKLSSDINVYKKNLDINLENFNTNKEKLLSMVIFIRDIKKYISEIAESSNDMRTKSDGILNISKTIKKISDNSKMLSINAQIEAAKVSGISNGFDVISEEMVRMSDDTRNNSVLIDKTVNTIIKDIENLNKNISLNANKIEDSIALCEVIVEFVDMLSKEYKSNIEMFENILGSMNEIILFIEEIKLSMSEGYKIADDVFRNTSTEYIAIEGFLEEANFCKEEVKVSKNRKQDTCRVYENEKLKVLLNFSRDFDYDPIAIDYENERLICKNIYSKLFEESKSGTPIPNLSKGWTDEKAKVWTIYIKDNIRFSNGDLLTAEDVEFSFLRTCLKNKCSVPHTLEMVEGYQIFESEREAFSKKISGIKVVNKNTINITLKTPDILFLSKLSSNSLFIISKKEYLKSKKFIGAGRYYIENIDESEFEKVIHLNANKYNFRESSYIKDVEVTISKRFQSYVEDIENSYFDIIHPIIHTNVFNIRENKKGYGVGFINTYNIFLINFIADSKNKLLLDKNFRQSVFAILNKTNWDIDGAPEYFEKYEAISSYWRNNKMKIPKWMPDQPILKRLNGTLNIVTYDSWLTKIMANKVKTDLEKYGLKVNLYIDNSLEGLEKYDLMVGLISYEGNDFYSQLKDALSAPLGSFMLDKPLGDRLKELTKISNYKQRIEKLKDMELEILKEYYNLPIYYVKSFYIKRNNIMNLNDDTVAHLKFENIIKTID